MTKEKRQSLEKYANELKGKLADKAVPEKHKGHPESYKNFLKNELRIVTNQLEVAKLEGTPGK